MSQELTWDSLIAKLQAYEAELKSAQQQSNDQCNIISYLEQQVKEKDELIGDIQASWEQFGALTSDLEERIKKCKSHV